LKREAILSPLLILTVIGGLLPLGAASWWLFELVSHFRVQYVAVAIPVVLVAVASSPLVVDSRISKRRKSSL